MARPVRSVGRRLALIASAIAALLFAHAPAFAQPAAGYDALVDQYAQGDAAGALAALARWPASAVTNAASDRPRFMAAARQRAAVMLHTELAFGFLLQHSTGDIAAQMAAARRILAIMKNGGQGDDRTQAFERRWFAFIASMYTAHGQLDNAEWTVREGLTIYPRDARLHVARGCIREMNATFMAVDPRTPAGGQSRVIRLLEAAAADYRRAIAFDEALAAAYLHLGWVRFLGHDGRGAHDFELALEHAGDDATRYLAHLFLGAVAERASRLDDARREYEAALAAGPTYQTARIALSRAEEALGRRTHAQELAREFAALVHKDDDPWWDYHLGGFDAPSLDWLRREATSR